jgi:IMP dehydrogenase
MQNYHISGFPVVEEGSRLVGIVTNRDLRFVKKHDTPIRDVMTKDKLVTVPPGTTLEDAEEILHKHRIEKLLVVGKTGNLKGLITIKDIRKRRKFPNAARTTWAALGAPRWG